MARREILVINPSRRRRRKTRKRKTVIRRKAKPMARRRRRRKTTVSRKRTYRRNPAKRKRSRARATASKIFGGLNFKKAIGDMPAIQIGMFAATWSAKRWGADATQTDPASWTWDSYLKGAIGGVGAAILANMMKRGSGQKVLEGAFNLMVYKAVQNELIVESSWATAQFGADDDDYSPEEYLMTGDENWFLGQDGEMYPTDEAYRLPEASYDGYGDTLQPVTSLGDTLQPVTSLGSAVEDKARRAWFRAV